LLALFVPRLVVAELGLPGARPGQISHDHIEFACLLSDLAGFSALSEALGKLGPSGEERIEGLLNVCFGATLDAVAAHGGDVLNFAGDALTAVFPVGPGRDLDAATAAAVAAGRRACAAINALEPVEGHRLQLRVGVAAGLGSRFDVGGVDDRWHHVAAGRVIDDLLLAAHIAQRGEVVLSPRAARHVITACQLESAEQGHARVLDANPPPAVPPLLPEAAPDELQELLRSYTVDEALTSLEKGDRGGVAEMRSVTSLFINLRNLDVTDPFARAKVREGVAAAQDVLRRFGGGVHKVTTDEKGILVVAVFGLPPHSHENNAARGARSSIEVHSRLRRLGIAHGIGVTTGRAWCGIIGNDWRREYTVIAPVVNQAARLMQAADDDVLCDDATVHGALGFVQFKPMPPVVAKGMALPLPSNKPLHKVSIGVRERFISRNSGPGELVGRHEELRLLEQRLNALMFEGQSAVAVVQGEPGIGKSALLSALLSSADACAVQTASTSADSLEANTPYYAWSDLFYRLLDVPTTWTEPQRRVQVHAKLMFWRVDPEFAALLNPILNLEFAEPAELQELTGVVRHSRTIDYATELFTAVHHGAPVVLVLDDVHWLDSASWDLLDQIQRKCAHILVVLGLRPVDAGSHPTLRRMRELAAGATIELGMLSRRALEELIARRLGATAAVPAEVVDLVVARAEGNPFVAEEMALVLRDAGAVTVQDGVPTLSAQALAEVRFPSTLQGLITARLDRLPADQQPTVKYAAVIGRSFAVDVLLGIHTGGLSREALLAQLRHLDGLRLTEQDSENVWSFRHAVIREAAYELLPFVARQRVHLAVAQWYERNLAGVGTSALAILAWHYKMAGDLDRALHWFERAGEHALQQGASREAIHFFAQVRAIADHATPAERAALTPLRRASWASRLGEARMGLGDLAGAQEALGEALVRLGEPVPTAMVGRGRRLIGEIVRQMWHLLRFSVQAGGETVGEVARAWALVGEICYFNTDIGGWALASLLAINRAESAGDVTIAARAYGGLANLAGTLRLRGLMRHYLERARQSHDPSARMAADWADAVYRLTFCDWAGAQNVLAHGIALGESSGAHYELGIGITILGYLHYCTEATGVALTTLRRGLASARDCGNLQHESWALTLMIPLLLMRNEKRDAERCEQGAGERLATSDPLSVPIYHGVKAQTRWRCGLRAQALDAADDALVAFAKAPPAGYIYLPGLTGLVEVALGERMRPGGDHERARRLAQRTLKVFGGFAMLFPFARARLALHRGQVAQAEGRTAAAARLFRKAARRAEQDGLRWERAWALVGLGHVTGDAAANAQGRRILEEIEDFTGAAN